MLSLQEIERGSFKHLGGRVYCADCVAKMRSVGPIHCPQCGTTDTPLYDGKAYVCRKCGAQVSPGGRKPEAAKPKPSPKPKATSKPPKRPVRPSKKCPYCGGVIPAESLKCRYCGSPLTREAHDLETVGRQNLRMRFWLGCSLSASIFLLIFLIFALSRRSDRAQAGAPAAAGEQNAAALQELAEKLEGLAGELASLKGEAARQAQDRSQRLDALAEKLQPLAEKTQELAADRVDDSRRLRELDQRLGPIRKEFDRLKASITSEREQRSQRIEQLEGRLQPLAKQVQELRAGHETGNPAVSDRGQLEKLAAELRAIRAELALLKPAGDGRTAEQPEAKEAGEREQAAAAEERAAAAAYPDLEAQVDELKDKRRYGEAIVACRQFIALYLGTPQAERAKALQKDLRDELERLRTDHARRFRQAMDEKNYQAAREVVAALSQYRAPEIREDRQRMLAALAEATKPKPDEELEKYLARWEPGPQVERFLHELESKDSLVRQGAAEQLARFQDPAALGGLIAAIHDNDWFVTAKAIEALAAIGDPIALPHVAKQAKAAIGIVSVPAARAAKTLAGASREKYADAWKLVDADAVARDLVEALELMKDEETVVAASCQPDLMAALARLDAKEAAPAIRPFLKSKSPKVRQSAAAAIKKLTGEDIPAEPAQEGTGETEGPAQAPGADVRASPDE
ncbi:MAG: HEAT repeat domain-containing protein [Candidatus Brocadiia bacterium]